MTGPIEHPVEVLPAGWETRKVWIQHTNQVIENRLEIVEIATGRRYQHEPLCLIANKCMALFLGGQFYGLVYVLWHFLRAPLAATTLLFRAVRETLDHPKLRQILQIFSVLFWRAPVIFIENILAALRAPYFALRIELAGVYGYFYPLKGKLLIEEIEKSLHHRERREDQAHFTGTYSQKIWRGLTDPENRMTLLLAYCMWSLGKLNDPNVLRHEVQTPVVS